MLNFIKTMLAIIVAIVIVSIPLAILVVLTTLYEAWFLTAILNMYRVELVVIPEITYLQAFLFLALAQTLAAFVRPLRPSRQDDEDKAKEHKHLKKVAVFHLAFPPIAYVSSWLTIWASTNLF